MPLMGGDYTPIGLWRATKLRDVQTARAQIRLCVAVVLSALRHGLAPLPVAPFSVDPSGQARTQKVRVAKEGNCLIEGTHYRAVDRLASALSGPELGPRLAALCARWRYSACLGFALPLAEQQRLDFQYHYSIWQLEYSRNYLFHQAQVLEEVFQKLIDRTRAPARCVSSPG